MAKTVLNPGDLIRVGETLIVFSQSGQASESAMDPSCFADATRVRRISGGDKRHAAEALIGAESTSGPVRKLAFLYRLSQQIQAAETVDSLIRESLLSVVKVIGAQEARVVLRTSAGRLKEYATNKDTSSSDAANVLSNWVMETDQALLLNTDSDRQEPFDQQLSRGNTIGAPISGRSGCIGAFECFHIIEGRVFEFADLQFLTAVGHHLGQAIETLEQHERVKRRNEQLQNQLGQTRATFIGDSQPIRDLRQQIARVAKTNVTTLVLGESGTGKEVVSQLLHQLSERKDGPFVAANCAAFTDSLLESELFGHEKGAFTGADARRKGQFELADGGTIFLDEVGELSPSCQAKLLRLLEGQPFTRVGGIEPIEVNVRIVAATHRCLESMVREGTFREDLWYRLRVLELNMPPLRQRSEDILQLAEHFLAKFRREMGYGPTRLSQTAAQTLLNHDWPGNVRELRNAIERALVLAVGDEIEPQDFGIANRQRKNESSAQPPSSATTVEEPTKTQLSLSIADVERRHIESVLDSLGGNKTQACEILGITRASLYNKLKRYMQSDEAASSSVRDG